MNTLLNNHGNGGTWAETTGTPSGQFTAGTGIFDASGLTAGDYDFTYTVTNGTCQDVADFTITVVAPLTAGDDNTATLCGSAGASLDLNTLLNNHDNGGIWAETTATPSGQFTNATGTLDAIGLSGDYDFTYTVSASPCPDDIANFTVTVEENPVISISGGPTCSADFSTYDVDLTVSIGNVTSTEGTPTDNTGGSWTVSGVTGGNNITVTAVNGTCSVDLPITAPNCSCPVVNPPSGSDITECESGQTLTATATVGAGEVVDWYDAPINGNLVPSPTQTGVGSVTYYAETRNTSSGCISATRLAVTLTLNATPAITLGATANPLTCTDLTGSFELTGLAAGESYTINYNGFDTTIVANGSGIGTIINVLTGTYNDITVTAQSSGCPATYNALGVTLSAPSAPTVNAGNDVTICIGSDVTLAATTTASVLNWDNSVVDNVAFTPGTIGVFDYIATASENGCTETDTVRVTVAALPTIGIDRVLDTVCFGDCMDLTGTGGVTYNWSTGENTQTISVCPTDVTPYQLTITDANNCQADSTVILYAVDQPLININTNDLTLCDGETANVDAVANNSPITWSTGDSGTSITVDNSQPSVIATVTAACGKTDSDTINVLPGTVPGIDAGDNVSIISGSSHNIDASATDATTYIWTPAEGLSCTDCEDPTATPTQTTTYYVTTTSTDGCPATDSIVITVEIDETIWWPNAITGEMGDDDCCFIFSTDAQLEDYYLRIYNRWGELMFESRDQTEHWNGTFREKPVQTGVYTFVMDYAEASGNAQTIGGNITVIR